MARRARVLFFIAVIALTFSFVSAARAQGINAAPTFNAASGTVTVGAPDIYEEGRTVAVQPDGKILVAGMYARILDLVNWTYEENQLLLIRFNGDGSLDTAFGNLGYATANIWTSDSYFESGIGIAVLSDGKIVVGAGHSFIQHDGQPGFGAARFNSDGSVDTSFGVNGVAFFSSTPYQDTAHRMIVDSYGNILIVGESPSSPAKTFVARITPDGDLDSSFGSGGIVTTAVGASSCLANGIAVQSDGKIVVTGTEGGTYVISVLRYTTAGILDNSFGTGGIVTLDVAPSYDTGMAVAIQDDDKIVIGGYGTWTDQDFTAVRLKTNGSLDTTFSATGSRHIDLGRDEQIRSLSIQDGRILLSGYSGSDAAFVRLLPDGTLDATFNGTGSVVGAGSPGGVDTTVQPDGRIVSIGNIGNGYISDVVVLRRNYDGTNDVSFGLSPADTLGNAITYVQGSSPVVLDADVSIFDKELSGHSFAGATLTLAREGGLNAGDAYTGSGTLASLMEGSDVRINGTVIGTVTTNSAGILTLTFTEDSTGVLVNEAMRQIAYSNNRTAVSGPFRITWTFSDGNTGSQGTGGAKTANGSTTVTVASAVPSTQTGAATGIGGSAATLQGVVSDNGLNTTVSFDYGMTVSYGTHVAGSPGLIAAGSGSTSVSAAISGLSCNTTYHFRVSATNSIGTSNGSDNMFTTGVCAPGAPTIGTAVAGDSQATISFTSPGSDGGAAITQYTATSSPGAISATGSSSPITVTGLTNGTAYTFRVTATNSAGAGPASAWSNSVTPRGTQTITFANPGSQNFGTTPVLNATSTSALSVTFTSSTTSVCTITSGGALTFVAAGPCSINADQAGNSVYLPAPTVTQTFSVVAVAPGAPTIGAAVAGDSQASVSFLPPASDGGAAITQYTATSSPGAISASGSSSPITVTGLTNGTVYTFRVTATNSAGAGPASAWSNSVTPNPGVSAPTATAASSIMFTAFTANWNSVLGADGYRLDVATDAAFINMLPAYRNLDVGSATSRTISGLTSGVSYYYRVWAYNSWGTSPASNTVVTTTAGSRTVTTLNDSGAGSLRQTIADSNPGDVIGFAEELNSQTITLTAPLVIAKDLTIGGPEAGVTISGNGASQIFQVTGNVSFTLRRVVLTGGYTSGNGAAFVDNPGSITVIDQCTFRDNASHGSGGALAVFGNVSITYSAIAANTATYGGAIYQNNAGLAISNVTLSGNTATSGGALYELGGATMLANTTIAANSASTRGGGILVSAAGSLTLVNSILANNSAAEGNDLYGPILSQGHNLIRDISGGAFVPADNDITSADPLLANLADNGGHTQTMALLAHSPAINAGACSGSPAVDQRGMSRPQGNSCDIGAYERGEATTFTEVSGTPQSAVIGAAFASPLKLKVIDSLGVGLDGVAVTFTGPATGAGITGDGTDETDAAGTAEYSVTANNMVGSYTVTATTGTLSAAYSLTNEAPVQVAQTIGAIIFSPGTLVVGGETTVSATASSGLPVSFSSLTPAICGVIGENVSGLSAGICTVRAEQPGNLFYLPAPPRDQDLQVGYSSNSPALAVSALTDGAITAAYVQNVSGLVSDPSGIQSLTLNGTPVRIHGDGTFTYPLELLAGDNTVTVVATNNAGISATDTRSITLNSAAPLLWITNPPDNAALGTQTITVGGTIQGDTSDPVSTIEYAVNGATLQPAALAGSNYSFSAYLVPGMNTIRISAITASGLQVEAKRTVFYAPGFSVGITNPIEDARTPLGRYTLIGSVSDNTTPVQVTITVDDLTFTPEVVNGVFQQELSLSDEKVHQVTVSAIAQGGSGRVTRRNIILDNAGGSAFTIGDAMEALQASLGLVTPSPAEILRLDVTPLVNGNSMGDGRLDIEDAVVILRMAVGSIQ